MLHVINANNINDAVFKSLNDLINDGQITTNRNAATLGNIYSINNAFVEIMSPKSRHLNLEGRKNNIFATIAETFWVFAGSNRIDPYLSYFLPRAADFSDDGVTWRGGYPERIVNASQLDDVIQQFRNEGIFTRRAVLQIYDANLDTTESLQKVYGIKETKDRPCNLIMDFFITPDKKLHMNVKSRSGDVIWGFGSINIFEWTFLQEMVLQYVQEEIDNEVTLGTYNHHVTNLHLYESTGAQGFAVLENVAKHDRVSVCDDHIDFPMLPNSHEFFKELVSFISLHIKDETMEHGFARDCVRDLFADYGVAIEGNLLYKYAEIVLAYVTAKKHGATKENHWDLKIDLNGLSSEFADAIVNSAFRKFTVVRSETGE